MVQTLDGGLSLRMESAVNQRANTAGVINFVGQILFLENSSHAGNEIFGVVVTPCIGVISNNREPLAKFIRRAIFS